MESHQYTKTVFSQTIGPIEFKFNVKTLYDMLTKTYTKYFCRMTKMTAMHIYGKNPSKIFFSRTRKRVTLGLGPRGCLQFVIVVFPDHTHLLFLVCSTGDVGPTYLTSRSNLLPNAFKWDFFENC